MAAHDLITEAEAAQQAGVSAKTLHRFSEAGYLTVRIEDDGSRLYAQSQIVEIFGAFQGAAVPLDPDETGLTSNPIAPVGAVCPSAKTTFRPDHDEQPAPTTHSEPAATVTTKDSIQEPAAPPTPAAIDTSHLEAEIQRLKNLTALQERILDMKDAELQDLRSQRDWLRTRVEKLEEKGDRDQVLLLSETQAIRQLISIQQRPRSTVRTLLDWFGLGNSDDSRGAVSNQDVAQSAIVVNRAANS